MFFKNCINKPCINEVNGQWQIVVWLQGLLIGRNLYGHFILFHISVCLCCVCTYVCTVCVHVGTVIYIEHGLALLHTTSLSELVWNVKIKILHWSRYA